MSKRLHEYAVEFGQKVKARRLELGMSVRDLMVKMRYKSTTAITSIESGDTDVPQSRIPELAKALQVDIPYFFISEEKIAKDIEMKAKNDWEFALLQIFRSLDPMSQAKVMTTAQQLQFGDQVVDVGKVDLK